MKRLFGIFLTVFVCFSIFSVAAAADRDNYVIDEAGLLEDKEIEKLSENIEDLSDKYNMDIVLLTDDSLNGKTPWQKLKSVEHLIPIQPDVTKQFWDSEEEVWPRNYEYLKRFKNPKKK